MESCPSQFTARRRKVRKDAQSCRECRRRKVKCVYTKPSNAVCIACQRRQTQCISQCDSSGPTNDADSTGNARAKASMNDALFTRDPQANDVGLLAHEPTRQALLRALPCTADIRILSEKLSIISAICYQSDYKSHSSGSEKMPKEQIPFRTLLHPETHPTLLARQMLLSAAAMQDLSHKDAVPGLSEHQHAIMKRLAESAIKLVNMDDAFLGTLEGLENLIFEMFYHIDSGNIYRAWTTTRRAITAAQILGLHRPEHYRFLLIDEESDLEPEIMWSTIVSMERMLSLLLDLPTSTGHTTLAFQTISSDSPLGHNLSALVGSLAAKILERNQVEMEQQALEMTGALDREITLAAEQMPSAFWRPLDFAGLERDSSKALTETRRAFGHMCYYSLVVQLHMPHMLRFHDASQAVYSKIACSNASREILNREIQLRTFNPISACCRMSDFLSLIAGMALMLGHITSHCGNEGDNVLTHQRLGDRAIVERALACVDPSSDLNGGVLVVRCTALVKDLLTIEEDVARQRRVRACPPQEIGHNQETKRDVLIMRVPYLGIIQISQEGVIAIPATRIEQTQSLSEGVTIGGIGSILPGRSRSSNLNENCVTANIEAPLAAPMSLSKPHLVEYNAPVLSAGSPLQLDMMLPQETGSFDDLGLRDVDAAYIETFMRNSPVPLATEIGWDIGTFT